MGIRALTLSGVLAAGLLVGCGGSTTKPSTSAGAKPSAGLASRVLTDNQLPGFTTSPSTPDIGASAYATDSGIPAARKPAEVKRLERLGFISALLEDLSDGSTPGLSIVEKFRTTNGAQGEVRYESATFPNVSKGQGQLTRFAVPRIPGAQGYGVLTTKYLGGINISFSKGNYYYLVGQELTGKDTARTQMRVLIATAQNLYKRVSP